MPPYVRALPVTVPFVTASYCSFESNNEWVYQLPEQLDDGRDTSSLMDVEMDPTPLTDLMNLLLENSVLLSDHVRYILTTPYC
jgi:hypothetical protein